MTTLHKPVLLNEVVTYLKPTTDHRYIDATLGGGGHTEAILAQGGPNARVIGIDRDSTAIERSKIRLKQFGSRVQFAVASYSEVPQIIERLKIKRVQGILLDLGLSSDQLDDTNRGFSFRFLEAELDLRFDPSTGESAARLLQTVSEKNLADILFHYGELQSSRRLAGRILEYQHKNPIDTVGKLLEASGLNHPKSRSQLFQALRIAVNDELNILKDSLPELWRCLDEGGRMAIISFHSLEDRIVKTTFNDLVKPATAYPILPVQADTAPARFQSLSRRPIAPSADEIAKNPRARSARLRAVQRLNVEGQSTS